MKLTKAKLVNYFVKYRLRVGRGKGYFSEANDIILVAVALKVYGVPLWLLPIIVIKALAVCYFVGYIDERYVKLWQREHVYQSKDVNPFFKQMDNKINEVLRWAKKK